MKKLPLVLTPVLLLSSCTPVSPKDDAHKGAAVAKGVFPYEVKVTDFYGAEGYGHDYYVTPESVTVVYWNDFGSPKKQVLKRDLTTGEKATWKAYLQSLRLDSLAEKYEAPDVSDGLQRWFYLSINGKKKDIVLRNRDVPELFRLSDRVNELLPDRLRMRYGGAAAQMRQE